MATTYKSAKTAPVSPVEEAKSLIEKAGYKLAAIIRQDDVSVLFVSIFGRAHTAWWGKDKRGNRKMFVDEGFLAMPTPYSFDEEG